MNVANQIAKNLKLPEQSVSAALKLFADGNSIPFVARYRKEMIRGIDELSLRDVAVAAEKLEQLEQRRAKIIETLVEKKLLTPSIRLSLEKAQTLAALEEIYRPFKSSRLTKAGMARKAGLEPLAELMLAPDRELSATNLARPFVNPSADIQNADDAIEGAVFILAERFSLVTDARSAVKDFLSRAMLLTRKKRGYSGDDARFESFFDQKSLWAHLKGHRLLAIARGENEGVLSWKFEFDRIPLLHRLARALLDRPSQLQWRDLKDAIEQALDRHLAPSASRELMRDGLEAAEMRAVQVFSRNLRDLLLAAPAGPRTIAALDPGFRAGCKVAVIDANGTVIATQVIYPTPPQADVEAAAHCLIELIQQHQIELIALGNGQGSRETHNFLLDYVVGDVEIQIVRVSEAGASVYSASKAAVEELPELDISLRGAVSIARRLQDPLSELIKITPQSLGVGQYQHDLDQRQLETALNVEVTSCVNKVGVDLNTASVHLLRHVAGLDKRTANTIVTHRLRNGAFRSRDELQTIKGIGVATFRQCAGFLRIRGGAEVLDATGIHPESYHHAHRISEALMTDCASLIGKKIDLNPELAQTLADSGCGQETLVDIVGELAEPGRDPRFEFQLTHFRDDVRSITDLRGEMALEGIVGNITEFGAFVDLGLETDGLVHISEIREAFGPGTNGGLSLGQTIKVRVIDVDPKRKRISLGLVK